VNNFDFYEYIRRLHLFVESQDKRLKQLEDSFLTLTENFNELKNKTSIHVDKIEYKFDQLKVETLEGTLNIGLNPTDLQGIDDFALEGKQANHSHTPSNQFQTTMRTEEAILKNIESDVSSIIQKYEQDYQVKIEDSYKTFIQNDIRKQLPSRIQYYLNQIPIEQRNAESSTGHQTQIIESIQKDIQNGIHVFLNNLPNEVKGRVEK
jgi:spore germination protein PC